jgi:hypothetical protein
MGSVDFNLQNLRSRKFKGYLQMQDPDATSNYLRLKELQTFQIGFTFNREAHYDDQGQKALDPAGYQHSFSCSIKTTADMFDTGFTWLGFESGSNVAPSDKSSLSYWIYKNQNFEPVELIFITTMETLGSDAHATTGNKYLHMKFTCNANSFTPVTRGGSAISETEISGEITKIEAVKRTGVATTLSG